MFVLIQVVTWSCMTLQIFCKERPGSYFLRMRMRYTYKFWYLRFGTNNLHQLIFTQLLQNIRLRKEPCDVKSRKYGPDLKAVTKRYFWQCTVFERSIGQFLSSIIYRMWVQILAWSVKTLVSLSKALYHNCFSLPRSTNEYRRELGSDMWWTGMGI